MLLIIYQWLHIDPPTQFQYQWRIYHHITDMSIILPVISGVHTVCQGMRSRMTKMPLSKPIQILHMCVCVYVYIYIYICMQSRPARWT
jgi:hypothetical protein